MPTGRSTVFTASTAISMLSFFVRLVGGSVLQRGLQEVRGECILVAGTSRGLVVSGV